MRDAIRPDELKRVTTDEPVPAPPSHQLDVPDLQLSESRWGGARISILLVYGLAFFAPITFSTAYGGGGVLFLCGLFCTVAYPFQFWKEAVPPVDLVVCWLANPLFWIGLSLLGSRRRSRRLVGGTFGACAALAALAWFLGWNDLAAASAWFGHRNDLTLVGPAYLLWCGSFVLLAVAGLVGGPVRLARRPTIPVSGAVGRAGTPPKETE